MNRNKLPVFGKKTALILSINISLILIVILLLGISYGKARDVGREIRIADIVTANSFVVFFLNILMLYILFRFQFWVINRYKKHRKGFWIGILGSLLLVVLLSSIFSNIQLSIYPEPIHSNIFITFNFVKDLVLLLISFLFTALMLVWNQNQETIVENQRLMVENLQNRYDALKSQVDPHFLFNSLNTLNGLVGYDDEKAHEYIDQLSSVFRYTMSNKPVIRLSEELEFTESYTYLMKIRYNESLRFEYKNIDEKYLEYFILPFGLQLLVENAVKHNVISKKHPLVITIETTGHDTIKIKNNVQPKVEQVSSGVGLANLNERYHLMFNQDIGITHNDEFFTVEIPLIKEIKNITLNTIINHESCHC